MRYPEYPTAQIVTTLASLQVPKERKKHFLNDFLAVLNTEPKRDQISEEGVRSCSNSSTTCLPICDGAGLDSWSERSVVIADVAANPFCIRVSDCLMEYSRGGKSVQVFLRRCIFLG